MATELQKPETMDLRSMDISADKKDRLKQLFPGAFTETKDEHGNLVESIDFDQLKAELGEYSDLFEGRRERYGMDWPGKKDCLKIIQQPSIGTLKPCREESVNFDGTENLFIEGDNLEVLKLLQKSYYGKVKMIYIDPPYNTGKEFIYPDDYTESLETYLSYAGLLDDEGRKFSTNTPNEGRFHTKWLNMMYPRLYLARNLLREDGVIFISIDDNECDNLRLLCNQIFGEESYIATHYIQVRFPSKTLAEKHDYQKLVEQVLVYRKGDYEPIKEKEKYSLEKFCWQIIETGSGRVEKIGNKTVRIFLPSEYRINKTTPSINGLKETWASGSVLKINASGKYFGNYLAPRKHVDGLGVLYKVDGIGEDGLGYRYFTGPKRDTATKGKFYSGVPLKRREELKKGKAQRERPILNLYNYADAFGNCRHEGDTDFRSGKKPIIFVKMLLKQSVKYDDEQIVLDFFAGSCSTAHAVMDLNKEDGGNRKFIMVQLPEPCDEESEAYKAGYKNVADIGKERIRRVIKKIEDERAAENYDPQMKLPGIEEEKPLLDLGFKVFKLDRSNFRVWDGRDPDIPLEKLEEQLALQVDHIDPEAGPEDILYELLLKAGFMPTERVERLEMAGKTVYSVAEGALLICLENTITRELIDAVAAAEPVQFICLDRGFKGNDQLKANAVQTFNARNQGLEKERQIVFRTV